MTEKSRYIENIRLTAMFKAGESGVTLGDELIKAADSAETEAAISVGIKKEYAFFLRVKRYFPWLVESIRPSTSQENHNGADWWITFKKTKMFPFLAGKEIPAQVKSNPIKVDEFKNGSKYTDFEKKIIVMDFYLKIPGTTFKRKFMSEVGRIEDIFESE